MSLDARALKAHRWNNRLQSLLLLGGMVGLLALMGWVLGGSTESLWALGLGLGALVLGPQVSPWLVLRAYRARVLSPYEAPELYDLLARLGRRAGLEALPRLAYVPTRNLNAFAMGGGRGAVIALTDGLLRRLELRELAGVLAHELSHLRYQDTWLMGLADTVSRITTLATQVGWAMLVLLLVLSPFVPQSFPILAPLLLLLVPTLSSLLQLALSRTREFHADLGAVELTGDPEGLARALLKIEPRATRWWERLFLPGRREEDPALLRTHPATEERVRRLRALEVQGQRHLVPFAFSHDAYLVPAERLGRPRWHVTGLWH